MHNSIINFGALAKRVLASGYSTYRLGRELGLSQPTISRLANGKTQSINAEAGVRLICLAGGTVQLPLVEQEAERAAA